MKSSRHVFSNNDILAITAILLTIATAFAFVGVGLEAQNQIRGLPPVSVAAGESVTLYVMAGVMGKIPSLAGTLQSFAFAFAYGLTPFVALSMFAARTFSRKSTGACDALA
jgi:hypothetical protein